MEKEVYKKKKRNDFHRQPKKLIIISSEGKNKTEQNYFKKFNNKETRINFAPGNDTDPIKIAQNLKNYIQDIKDDVYYACALVDGDLREDKNAEIKEADEIAKQAGFEIILSNPCFEVWYICHYLFSTKNYSSNEQVINQLKKYVRDYNKNKNDMFEETNEKIDMAYKNAVKLEEFCLNNKKEPHKVDFSPSTEIYKVIDKILNKGE